MFARGRLRISAAGKWIEPLPFPSPQQGGATSFCPPVYGKRGFLPKGGMKLPPSGGHSLCLLASVRRTGLASALMAPVSPRKENPSSPPSGGGTQGSTWTVLMASMATSTPTQKGTSSVTARPIAAVLLQHTKELWSKLTSVLVSSRRLDHMYHMQ